MDVVVADIPPKYGMILLRSWGAKLKSSLQMDMSYATISVFWQPRKLYRETIMKYMVINQDKPNNYPIYYVHSGIDSSILYNGSCLEENSQNGFGLLEEKGNELQKKELETKS